MRSLATIACALLMLAASHGPVAGAEASPSPVPSAAATPGLVANPICAQAFAMAGALVAASLPSDASPTAGASPLPGASAAPELPVDRLDAAIRSCASLQDWFIASQLHPEAVQATDPMALLLARCTDPTTGLDAYATCRSLEVAMATPAPTPTPSPTPEPTPQPTPGFSVRLTNTRPALEGAPT